MSDTIKLKLDDMRINASKKSIENACNSDFKGMDDLIKKIKEMIDKSNSLLDKEPIFKEFKKELENIGKQIERYGDAIEKLIYQYDTLRSHLYNRYGADFKDHDLQNFLTDREKERYEYYRTKINDYMKKSYILIDHLRHFFTGQEEVFLIGFTSSLKSGTENNYEAVYSLSELFKEFDTTIVNMYNEDKTKIQKIDFQLKTKSDNKKNKEKITSTKTSLRNRAKEQSKKDYQNMRGKIKNGKDIFETDALFEDLYEHRNLVKKIIENESSENIEEIKKTNKGNVYEVYTRFKANGFKAHKLSGEWWNKKENKDFYIGIMNDVLKAPAAASQGGDTAIKYGDKKVQAQLKFLGKTSQIGLLRSAQVIKVFQETGKVLQNFAKGGKIEDLEKVLKRHFLQEIDESKKFHDKLLKEVMDEASLGLNSFLEAMKKSN